MRKERIALDVMWQVDALMHLFTITIVTTTN
jgi:hypothetical protein